MPFLCVHTSWVETPLSPYNNVSVVEDRFSSPFQVHTVYPVFNPGKGSIMQYSRSQTSSLTTVIFLGPRCLFADCRRAGH